MINEEINTAAWQLYQAFDHAGLERPIIHYADHKLMKLVELPIRPITMNGLCCPNCGVPWPKRPDPSNEWHIEKMDWQGKEIDISASTVIEDIAYSFIGFELSIRVINCFKTANVRTIDDLVSLTESELARIPGLGRKSVNEVKSTLSELGLSLADVKWIEGRWRTIPGYPTQVNLGVDSPTQEHGKDRENDP